MSFIGGKGGLYGGGYVHHMHGPRRRGPPGSRTPQKPLYKGRSSGQGISTMVRTRLAHRRGGSAVIRRRKQRRRFRRGMVKRRIPRSIAPSQKIIRMRATRYFNLTVASTTALEQTASINDITDPWGGSGSGQPLYYDQVSALYKTAIVIGAKVRGKFYNHSTAAMVVGISLKPFQNTTTINSYEHFQEMVPTRSRILSPDVDHGNLSLGTSVKKYFKVNNVRDEENLSCDLATESGPSWSSNFSIWVQRLDQAVTSSQVQATVTVEYIVLLRDRIIPDRSVET